MLFRSQFAGFMGVGMLIMLIFGIIIVVTRNKVMNVQICLVMVLHLSLSVFSSVLTQANHCCLLLLATSFSLMLITACHNAVICFPVFTSLHFHFTFLSFPECDFWMFSVSTHFPSHFSSTSLDANVVLFSSCR